VTVNPLRGKGIVWVVIVNTLSLGPVLTRDENPPNGVQRVSAGPFLSGFV